MKDGQAGPEAMYQFCQRLAGETHSGCRHRVGGSEERRWREPPHPANTTGWDLLAGSKAGLSSLKEGEPAKAMLMEKFPQAKES